MKKNTNPNIRGFNSKRNTRKNKSNKRNGNNHKPNRNRTQSHPKKDEIVRTNPNQNKVPKVLSEKISNVNDTKKTLKPVVERDDTLNEQHNVQNEELIKIDDKSSPALVKAVKERDRSDQPKLTGLLNTNTQILDVLQKMYQNQHDSQNTEIENKSNLPVLIPNDEPSQKQKPDDKNDDKKDDGLGLGGILSSLLSGSLLRTLTGGIFGRLMRFSPLKMLFKGFKSITRLLSKPFVKLLKYVKGLGLKTLKSIVSFVKGLLPYGVQLLKMMKGLSTKVVTSAATIAAEKLAAKKLSAKIAAKKAADLLKKNGAKVTAKVANKIALKVGGNLAARGAVASVPIAGWVVTGALVAVDATNGYKNAGENIGVDKEEITPTNKSAGAIASVLTLGMATKDFTKSVNEKMGGVESIYSKRYENKNVIVNNTFTHNDVDFNKFTKLSSKQMKEVFLVNNYTEKDKDRMLQLIREKIIIEKSSSNVNIHNVSEKIDAFTTETNLNNKFSDISNKYITRNERRVYRGDNSSTPTKNYTYNGRVIKPINNDNNGVDAQSNKQNTPVKFDKSPKIEPIKPINNDNNGVDAQSNKSKKEQITQDTSTNLTTLNNEHMMKINTQMAQVNVQQINSVETSSESGGGDRALNLFADLI